MNSLSRCWSRVFLIALIGSGLGCCGGLRGADPSTASRPRAREAGVIIGQLPTGAFNAITDVPGVLVGQTTLIQGENIRTGVTAILPHGGNLYQEKVPGAVFVANGSGKLIGSTQIEELGEIETPVLLTSTLNIPRVADALLDWMLALPGNERVRSVNAVVGETNDGRLNDIRSRPVGRDEVMASLRDARSGPVQEGAVGAGTGTIAFGFKGGIGTSSRVVADGGYTVGVLVQSNFGGHLLVNGAPVGQELAARGTVAAITDPAIARGDGSIIIVVATDAPLDARLLRRLSVRAVAGLARTGSLFPNASGDYVIAFSTAASNRVRLGEKERKTVLLSDAAMTPLFQAAIEATEEAIINSLFKAEDMRGFNGYEVKALPIAPTLEILRRHDLLRPAIPARTP